MTVTFDNGRVVSLAKRADAEGYYLTISPKKEYPKPCDVCGGVIQSEGDLDWHGYGNCRDIPEAIMRAPRQSEQQYEYDYCPQCEIRTARLCGICGGPLRAPKEPTAPTEEKCSDARPDDGIEHARRDVITEAALAAARTVHLMSYRLEVKRVNAERVIAPVVWF